MTEDSPLTPQHSLGSGFGRDSTAADVVAGIDLSGRNAVVTGGHSGLGLETPPALEGKGGVYCEDCDIAEPTAVGSA
jgi:hypothetical protein